MKSKKTKKAVRRGPVQLEPVGLVFLTFYGILAQPGYENGAAEAFKWVAFGGSMVVLLTLVINSLRLRFRLGWVECLNDWCMEMLTSRQMFGVLWIGVGISLLALMVVLRGSWEFYLFAGTCFLWLPFFYCYFFRQRQPGHQQQ